MAYKENKIEVSIVIPVYNHWDYTDRCIISIFEKTPDITYEIVIIDDCSMSNHDYSKSEIYQKENVKIYRNESNQGFVNSCNKGADLSIGRILVFLNNDTEVKDNWLKEIINTLSQYKDAGIVGAKLIYPNDILQEAGSIIFQDGSGWNYGKGDNPSRSPYNYIREVDYCSGACLGITKELWESVGGFDTLFAPAYYEDTDLCFKVRELGYKVIYQPKCEIIHYEGISSGTDITSGTKRFQEINKFKFRRKWEFVLNEKHWPSNPYFLNKAKTSGKKLQILIIDHRIPEFDKDAGSLRMDLIIKMLLQLGYNVTFYPDSPPSQPYLSVMQDLGVEVIIDYSSFEDFIKERAFQFEIIWMTRPHTSFNKLDIIKSYSPTSSIIYDTNDVHFIREMRRASIEGSQEVLCKANIEKMQEDYLTRNADLTIVVTDTDRDHLLKMNPQLKIRNIPCIYNTVKEQSSYESREGIVFVGGFLHLPNVDGIRWFVKEVWPIFHNEMPNIPFYIIGSNATDEIKIYDNQNGIKVLGFVPQIKPWLLKSRISVAPLRYGAGMKGKVVEAMAHGLPVVTTSIGAEGMRLNNMENVIISDNPKEFAAELINLYTDKKMWNIISSNSFKHVSANFCTDVVINDLESILNEVNGTKKIRKDILELQRVLSEKKVILEYQKEIILKSLRVSDNKSIFIWGSGNGGVRTLFLMFELGVKISGFIDSNEEKWNKKIHDYKIYSPKEVFDNKVLFNPFFIIGSMYSQEITQELARKGFTKQDFWVNYQL